MSFLLVHAKLNLNELDADSIVIGLSMFRCFGQFVVSTRYLAGVLFLLVDDLRSKSTALNPPAFRSSSKSTCHSSTDLMRASATRPGPTPSCMHGLHGLGEETDGEDRRGEE